MPTDQEKLDEEINEIRLEMLRALKTINVAAQQLQKETELQTYQIEKSIKEDSYEINMKSMKWIDKSVDKINDTHKYDSTCGQLRALSSIAEDLKFRIILRGCRY